MQDYKEKLIELAKAIVTYKDAAEHCNLSTMSGNKISFKNITNSLFDRVVTFKKSIITYKKKKVTDRYAPDEIETETPAKFNWFYEREYALYLVTNYPTKLQKEMISLEADADLFEVVRKAVREQKIKVKDSYCYELTEDEVTAIKKYLSDNKYGVPKPKAQKKQSLFDRLTSKTQPIDTISIPNYEPIFKRTQVTVSDYTKPVYSISFGKLNAELSETEVSEFTKYVKETEQTNDLTALNNLLSSLK